jgi:hypothetical protein
MTINKNFSNVQKLTDKNKARIVFESKSYSDIYFGKVYNLKCRITKRSDMFFETFLNINLSSNDTRLQSSSFIMISIFFLKISSFIVVIDKNNFYPFLSTQARSRQVHS